MLRFLLVLVTSVLTLSPASAHTEIADASGFAHGFLHPLSGIDHVLAMIATGLYAALRDGCALWLVPLSFIAMMAVGGALGMAGIAIPFAEVGIAASVLVLGLAIAARLSIRASAAMALAGLFAIFHGYAHGAEMPDSASGLAYAAGFIGATALLHATGIAVGVAVALTGDRHSHRFAQAAGGLIGLAGIGLLAAYL